MKFEDPAHDLLHIQRVVRTAKTICEAEQGDLAIVLPAAWLHDLVNIPKDDPRRSQASQLSANAAIEFLSSISYPNNYFEGIYHAIEAHSFSAKIEPKTKEAMIVQDADRLDGLGAIGIARCFSIAGLLGRPFYSASDPFCENRNPDDSSFTIDHFYQKLFKVADSLRTDSGRSEGQRRIKAMSSFLNDLSDEI